VGMWPGEAIRKVGFTTHSDATLSFTID